MNPENFQENVEAETKTDHLAQLKCVTPVSKYLSLALFIILPFLGAWVGYTYAPEKVVEVEVVKIVKENNNISDSKSEDPNDLLIDEKYGDFYLESYSKVNCGFDYSCFTENFLFLGTTTISGYFQTGVMDGPHFVVLDEDLIKLPNSITGLDLVPTTIYKTVGGDDFVTLKAEAEALPEGEILYASLEIEDLRFMLGAPKGGFYVDTNIINVLSTSTKNFDDMAMKGTYSKFQFDQFVTGEQYGNFIFDSYLESEFEGYATKAIFDGKVTILGYLYVQDEGGIGRWFDPVASELSKIPVVFDDSKTDVCILIKDSDGVYNTSIYDDVMNSVGIEQTNFISKSKQPVSMVLENLLILDPDTSGWCYEADLVSYNI